MFKSSSADSSWTYHRFRRCFDGGTNERGFDVDVDSPGCWLVDALIDYPRYERCCTSMAILKASTMTRLATGIWLPVKSRTTSLVRILAHFLLAVPFIRFSILAEASFFLPSRYLCVPWSGFNFNWFYFLMIPRHES